MNEKERTPKYWVYAFGIELFVVVAALLWNHTAVHQGGWNDLAVGIGDIFIIFGAFFYSFVWAIAALVRLVRRRRTFSLAVAVQGLALHCLAMIALAISAMYLLA
ncbi:MULTISPECIES: hypothetical protein [unclassified Burkholderia]|uniref:hypothetical protein n=1 Tax=unclassified Burkholderia TaxID=2613784 RepID=UPI0014214951|nr:MULTISPECIES: hypothetical protein [unclassified Burkholderia]NIE55009.1 hypothetical protein [Burkholderia sp. Ap-955]NIF08448.1 hypothetical protein [Burkholderia sp. Ax-1735]NIG01340.1 hypothetical protein [Burkholderia sp. Tr-849]